MMKEATTMRATILTIILASFIIPIVALPVHADLALDSIHFDPAIIASGDRVDIVVQFHDTGLSMEQQYIGDPAYQLKITLEADDRLTEQYILMEDTEGKDFQGMIARGGNYNKIFRVKVNDNAPAGNYGFKLTGQWYKDGTPVDSSRYMRFTMPVKRQGIALSVANVLSTPERVRSGDKDILLTTTITNTGEKQAKNVRMRLTYPDGITSSYTNDNELTIGAIDAGQSRDVQFYIDTERTIKEGSYDIGYDLTYLDLDNNGYSASDTFPFVIKKKPDMIVTQSAGTGLAGEDIILKVTVKNQGEEKADAVDVRILKQSSQPFDMDVRSDYLGQLAPGEEGTAIFTISAKDDAEIKSHKLNVIIRAKGDASEGDDNIYTYSDAATITVTGEKKNNYPLYAGVFVVVVIIAVIVSSTMKKNGKKR